MRTGGIEEGCLWPYGQQERKTDQESASAMVFCMPDKWVAERNFAATD